jgi:hypothetical protein
MKTFSRSLETVGMDHILGPISSKVVHTHNTHNRTTYLLLPRQGYIGNLPKGDVGHVEGLTFKGIIHKGTKGSNRSKDK